MNTDDGGFEFRLDLENGFTGVLMFAVMLGVIAWVLWIMYRTMQRPRLPVIAAGGQIPRANWAGVLKYGLVIPFMVPFWFVVLLILLAACATERSAAEVAITAATIVCCARALAHINEDIAHEVGKTVPIVILGFVLIGGGFAGSEKFGEIFEQLQESTVDDYILGLVIFDYIVTALWFAGLRLNWRRQRRRSAAGKSAEGGFQRAIRQWREIGTSEKAN